MRVSSLSDARVIRLVTTYFVPVWLSRDAYQQQAPPREEWTELQRIDQEQARRGLAGGAVCVFLLDPDGSVAAAQLVQKACNPDNLVPFLQECIDGSHLRQRDTAAVNRTRAGPRALQPISGPDRLVLHTWTRYQDMQPNRGTSQDWVEYTAAEWARLLPPPGLASGRSWRVPRAVADRLCERCYPPSPSWSVKECKVVDAQLDATAVPISLREVRVRLEGKLTLVHPAEGKETDRRVKADVLGYLRYDPTQKKITSFVLASREAESVWYWQGRPQPQKMEIAMALEAAE
jgi:hypothetical protein